MAGATPPFLLLALTFAVATLVGFSFILSQGQPLSAAFSRSPASWAIGVYGLFGFHAAYYVALTSAPVAIANLINYLWPLLLVLFSSIGHRCRSPIVGAAIGFAGVALLAMAGGLPAPTPPQLFGYAAAAVSAVIWASYSALSARRTAEPTATITGFCLVTSLLAWPIHFLAEPQVWPQPGTPWVAVLLLGLGPMGSAFFLWDHGLKRGSARTLGVLAYAAPVASTALLVIFGLAPAHWALAAAALMVAAGAALAARARW